MAQISTVLFVRRLRADVSSHIQFFSKGKRKRSGRGLSFWFLPGGASITQAPMDDRELPFILKAQSADFQDLTVQGRILWRVSDAEKLSERIDLTLNLKTGAYTAGPLEQINNVLVALTQQFTAQYLLQNDVRSLLQGGPRPLQMQVIADLKNDHTLEDMGLELINLTLASLVPTSELERALQTPTFEALQQKADEATFERRAMAVEKERAIAENQLQNEIELAARKKSLIEKEDENTRIRAVSQAETNQISANSKAESIRAIDQARVDMEKARMGVFEGLDPSIVLALAAQEFAGKLNKIDSINISPDMLSNLFDQLKGISAPAAPAKTVAAKPKTPKRAPRSTGR